MADLSTDERVKLNSFLQTIHRDCWITLWHNPTLNVDLVIGAGSKEACIRAFEVLAGHDCNEDLVYRAVVVATKDDMQPFRALWPEQSIFCTCVTGAAHPSEFCDLHGGRYRG